MPIRVRSGITSQAQTVAPAVPAAPPASWLRLALVLALQFLPLGLVLASASPWAWLVAGIMGSVICCAGTDSGWRWRNRGLVLLAVAWLVLGLLRVG